MKNKTHKSTAKRVKLTAGGKVTRSKRRYRNSRINRKANKPKNTDLKNLKLAKVEAKKIKLLIK